MDNDNKILFFTCATKFYKNYIVPYIYFAKKSNPSSTFEFIIDDEDGFYEKNTRALTWLKENLGVEVVFRSIGKIKIRPKIDNSLRFVTQPVSYAEYVYIGDIDIMIVEDIYSWHKPLFESGLPYSNIVREGTKRLTGLHFAKYNSFYPLPNTDDLVLNVANDEELLYLIVERKGLLYKNELYCEIKRGRPIHGIHMSLNRLPFSFHEERVGWGIRFDCMQKVNGLVNTDEFNEFLSTCYSGSAQILVNLIFLSRGVCDCGESKFKFLSSL